MVTYWSGTITIFPDKDINLFVFTKVGHTWSKYNKFTAISNSHARAVDAFIPEPSSFELFRVQMYNNLISHKNIYGKLQDSVCLRKVYLI